jgi:hypothetical protein
MGKVLVEVLHRLLMTSRVLRRMPAMTARRNEGIPSLIGVLMEISVMAQLMI